MKQAVLDYTRPVVEGGQPAKDVGDQILFILDNTKESITYELDLGDTVQYEFVLNSLKRSGETPDKSPQTFKALKQAHEEAAKNGKPGLPKISSIFDHKNTSNDLHALNKVSNLDVSGTAFKSTIFSTYPGGTYKTAVVQNLMALNNKTIAAIISQNTTQFIKGEKLISSLVADLTENKEVVSLAAFILFPQTGLPKVYTSYLKGGEIKDVEAKNTDGTAFNKNDPSTKLDEPSKKVGVYPDTIRIALNRIQTSPWKDCDYYIGNIPGPTELPIDAVVPIKGSMKFPTSLFVSPEGHPKGQSLVTFQPTTGGAQKIPTIYPEPREGADRDLIEYKLVDSNTVVTFDFTNLTTDIHQDFGPQKQAYIDQRAALTREGSVDLNIELRVLNADEDTYYVGNFTSNQATYNTDPMKHVLIKKIIFYWGCLIAGTKIKLANGSLKNVEDFIGDGIEKVITNSKGETRIVTGVTRGIEDKPCITFKDSKNNFLMLTEDHPVVTGNKGVVLAKYLKKGDRVYTENGETEIVEVGSKKYDGFIWNIELGTEQEAAENKTTMYADGFLVGDSAMQQYYKNLDVQKRREDPFVELPVEWHEDYKNFVAVAGA